MHTIIQATNLKHSNLQKLLAVENWVVSIEAKLLKLDFAVRTSKISMKFQTFDILFTNQ